MNDSAPDKPTADAFRVEGRVEDIMLKLLDGIERDISEGRLASPHLDAYEALCRAERTRSGR